MKKQSNVTFYKGLPPEGALVKWFKPHHHEIIIPDDLMEESGNDKCVLDLFTKDSHHRGYSLVSKPKISFLPANIPKPSTTMRIMPFASRARVTRLEIVTCCFKSTLTNGVVC